MDTILLKYLFWGGLLIVGYTFIGYGIIIFLLNKWRRIWKKDPVSPFEADYQPGVTFVIPAYNEERWIEDKIKNSFELDYPADKINFLVVSDGSDDGTMALVDNYPTPPGIQLRHFYKPERQGKIAAVERIMPSIDTPISIFTDANTMLNKAAVKNMVKHFANPKVGVVSGEKRISSSAKGAAAEVGEGIYWKYESFLKNMDYQYYSVIGAAGELFAIRSELYEPIPRDSVIEDFYMTMTIASKGYRIAYSPDAYAMETGSSSVKEELKRKIRIAAGGFQSVFRLARLMNPFKYGKLSFQFLSRRVFRWVVVPIALPTILIANILLAMSGSAFFQGFLLLQILFYCFAFIGYLLEKRKLRFKLLFVPYYFCVMHYAVYRGFARFIKGSQSVLWERAKRA